MRTRLSRTQAEETLSGAALEALLRRAVQPPGFEAWVASGNLSFGDDAAVQAAGGGAAAVPSIGNARN